MPCIALGESLPLPRFVSLKDNQVNLRAGPALRFPIKYVYKIKHYPVEIIAEHQLWRQVREIDGTVGWIHRQMLDSARTIITKNDCALLLNENNNAPVVGYVEANVLGEVLKCTQSHKCKVSFDFQNKKIDGWIDKESLYGVYYNEIIN